MKLKQNSFLFFSILGLALIVVVWTFNDRLGRQGQSQAQALYFLQSKIISHVDGILRSFPWSEADMKLLKKTEMQDAPLRFHRNAAVLFYLRGQLKEGIKHYQGLLQLRPDDASLHFALASLLVYEKKYDGALAALRKTVELNPIAWEAHLKLAALFALRDDLSSALVACEQILRMPLQPPEPRLAAVYQDMAVYSLQKNHSQEALEYANRTLQLLDRITPDELSSFDRAQALWAKSRALAQIGDREAAKLQLQAALTKAQEVQAKALEIGLLWDLMQLALAQGEAAKAKKIEAELSLLLQESIDNNKLSQQFPWLDPLIHSN